MVSTRELVRLVSSMQMATAPCSRPHLVQAAQRVRRLAAGSSFSPSALPRAPIRLAIRRGTSALIVRASASDVPKGPRTGMDGVPRPGDELVSKTGRKSNFLIRAVAADAHPSDEDSSGKKDIPSLLMAAWDRFVRPLRDFGFGRKSVWEGGVGLFILGGIGAHMHAVSFVSLVT